MILYTLTRKYFFKIFSNSEAPALELLGNLKEMYHKYYMQSDLLSMFKSSTT